MKAMKDFETDEMADYVNGLSTKVLDIIQHEIDHNESFSPALVAVGVALALSSFMATADEVKSTPESFKHLQKALDAFMRDFGAVITEESLH